MVSREELNWDLGTMIRGSKGTTMEIKSSDTYERSIRTSRALSPDEHEWKTRQRESHLTLDL